MPTDSGARHPPLRRLQGRPVERLRAAPGALRPRRHLDEPHAIVPDVHIYVRSKVPWVTLPEGARAFREFDDLAAEWPPESLARRAALKG
jgi:hypothetical protein